MAKTFDYCDRGAINIDPRSGFCNSNSIFYSKRKPIPLPASDRDLDITTFIFSSRRSHDAAYIDAVTGRQLSFTQVWRAVESVAKCLSDMGIRKGQVVLLLSPNSIFFPIVSLSVMALGAIITTANPLNTSQEIAKQILDSNAALLFTIPQLLHKLLHESINNVPIVLITDDGNTSSDYSKRVINIRSSFLTTTDDHANTLADMMKTTEPSRDGRMKERVTQDDPAALLYSSGTTGVSKGVVCSHRNLVAMIGMVGGRLRMHEQDQIYIATVPMFHTFGFAVFVLTLLANGCKVVVLPKYGVDEMLSAVEKYKVTYLPLVPPILAAMADDADRINSKYNLKSLRYTLCGGAPLSKAATEAFTENYPQVNILQGYAMTESNGAGASTDALEECRVHGTAGLLTPNTEAKIVDPNTGEALPVNRTGELWLRGPSIMKGYYNNKEATECTVSSDGWLKTGDLCYIDHDGFLFIVDRLKELIKYKGYQVAPAELEALLLTHPEITHAAVIPFPDDKVGQYPMAYVVRRSGSSISDSAVMDFVAKQVAPYKKIRRVAFVASIPKTPSGKILRKDLIKIATAKL